MASDEKVVVEVRRSDGSRIVRVDAPRWSVSIAVGLVGLAIGGVGAIWGDYLTLRKHRAEFDLQQTRLAEQQRIIDDFEARVRQVRGQIDGWSELHARIWRPFGPEAGPAAQGTGVGGGTAVRHLAPPRPTGTSLLDEIERLGASVTDESDNLRALEHFMSRAAEALAALPSRWPVRGRVNSEFGPRASPWGGEKRGEFHSGIDIGARIGTPVKAPARGTVLFAGRVPEYGISLVIDHGNDIKSLYGHLSRLLVTQSQRVERGQTVALTGNTGRSSGPHLHYEILVLDRAVNPRTYLWH